ncbi:MAG: SDR family oxidoreductase [Bacteroidales bacterium]|nr:SDR family oxidoreductase [Bacteroidales bacterium]
MNNMLQESEIHNKAVALITGATSGIGKAFASEFARRQYDLILTGRRKEVIDRVADELRGKYYVAVRVFIADFTEPEGIDRLLQYLDKEGYPEVLVNNAGYGLGKIFRYDDTEHQLNMLKVHIYAPVMIIHKILPFMIGRKRGIIINVSSLAAFIPTSSNTMYTSTKAFLLNFSESLSLEVRKHGICVQCLCPGLTNTDFHTRMQHTMRPARNFLFKWMNPEAVIRYSMRCLNKGKVLCVPGFRNKLLVSLLPFVPKRLYYFVTERLQQESGIVEPAPYDGGIPAMNSDTRKS